MPSRTDVLRVRLVTDGTGKVKAEMLGVEDSFKRVEKSSFGLAGGLRSLSGLFKVLGGAALIGAAKSTISFADSIDKAAKAAGVGTEFLQEMRFASEQLGVSNKLVDEGFRRFTRRLGEFVNSGGGPAAKAIETLGIAVTDTNGKFRGSEVVFEDFAKAMEGLASDAERSAFAAQIFGDDAGPKLALLLNQGSAGIRELRQEARDLGVVLDQELVENAVIAQDNLSKLALIIKTQVTSAVAGLSGALIDFFELTDAARIKGLNEELEELTEKAKNLTEELNRGVSDARQTAVIRELKETGAQIGEINTELKELSKTAEDKPLGNLSSDMDEAAKEAAKLAAQLERIRDRLNPLQAKAKAYAAELAIITGSNLGLEQQAALIRQLDQEFADATGGPNKLKKSVEDVEKEIKKTGESAANELQAPFDRAAENIQRGFGNAFTEVFRHGEARFETFTDLIRDMFARLAGEIAALLIFRPAIIGSGLGGLGLLGGGTAAAAGGSGALASGGLGGLLASGSGLGLGATLGLTAGGIFGGTALSGGFGSTAGTAGGLAGGGLGAYLGLLVGSSTGLGPLGIPIGAALGSFLGGSIGGLFGGDDKQKFGFTTGAGGLQTPFGGLSVTSSKNVDADAIVRSLAGIDESIAQLLSPGQIERVRGDLAGTGQRFNVNSFDNEPFDVVKTRLVRIIDSVAQNTVASGLLNSIGRDPGNIDELVQAAGGIIEMINLFQDDGAELNQAEQALAAINEQFADLAVVAGKLGFSVDEVNVKLAEATAQLTTDFNTSIQDQILAIENPLQRLVDIEREAGETRLENAIALGADQTEVARLNALKINKILDDVLGGSNFSSSNSSIGNFLTSLKISGAGGLSGADQLGNAETLFNQLLPSARTDPAARAELAALLPALVDLKRDQLGSTSAFFEFTGFLDSTLRNLVDQNETVDTLEEIGSAITTGDNAIVDTLREENVLLREEIATLSADIRLLMNAPTALVG